MENQNIGHYTTHLEAIERKKWISNVKYDIALSLDKSSLNYYGNANIHFQIKEGIKEDDYKYVFLNFTKGGCKWISDDIIVNNSMMTGTNKLFYNNRINFSPVLKDFL